MKLKKIVRIGDRIKKKKKKKSEWMRGKKGEIINIVYN
jgi:hypothetical protein